MKEPLYIITGVSSLTGYRDQISRPMPEQLARERLQRELDNRKYQKHPSYKRLKMELYQAVQLTIKWEEEKWS